MVSIMAAGFFCLPEEELPVSQRCAYATVTMVCSSIGGFGAACQIRQWSPLVDGYAMCRKPSPNPRIILQMGIADLMASICIFLRGLIIFLTTSPTYNEELLAWVPLNGNVGFIIVTTVVEACCQFFIGSSFMWTVMHAFDTYFQINHKSDIYSIGLCICAWTVPALSTIGSFLSLLVFPGYPLLCPYGLAIALRYALSYAMLAIVLLANPAIYFLTALHMEKQLKETGFISYHHHIFMSAFRLKYIVIVIVFSLCWTPNVIDAVLHLMVLGQTGPLTAKSMFFPVWLLEGILNPLQGLVNCAVYGRHLLFRMQVPVRSTLGRESDDIVSENTPFYSRTSSAGYGT